MSDSQSRKQLAKKLSKNLGMATPLVVAAFGMAQVATAQSSNCPPGSTYTQGICLVTSSSYGQPEASTVNRPAPEAEAGSAHKASGEAEGSAHKASGEAEGSAHKASGEAEGSAHKASGEAEAGSAHKASGEAEGSAHKARGEAEGSAHKAKSEAEGSAYKKAKSKAAGSAYKK